MSSTPIFGRPYKVDFPGGRHPVRGRTMTGKRRVFGAASKAKVALVAAKGNRTTAQLASQLGSHTSQVSAWKKQFMAQVTELFADGRQRRTDQATDEQEL